MKFMKARSLGDQITFGQHTSDDLLGQAKARVEQLIKDAVKS